jgi:hypothetical protein
MKVDVIHRGGLVGELRSVVIADVVVFAVKQVVNRSADLPLIAYPIACFQLASDVGWERTTVSLAEITEPATRADVRTH